MNIENSKRSHCRYSDACDSHVDGIHVVITHQQLLHSLALKGDTLVGRLVKPSADTAHIVNTIERILRVAIRAERGSDSLASLHTLALQDSGLSQRHHWVHPHRRREWHLYVHLFCRTSDDLVGVGRGRELAISAIGTDIHRSVLRPLTFALLL